MSWCKLAREWLRDKNQNTIFWQKIKRRVKDRGLCKNPLHSLLDLLCSYAYSEISSGSVCEGYFLWKSSLKKWSSVDGGITLNYFFLSQFQFEEVDLGLFFLVEMYVKHKVSDGSKSGKFTFRGSMIVATCHSQPPPLLPYTVKFISSNMFCNRQGIAVTNYENKILPLIIHLEILVACFYLLPILLLLLKRTFAG